MGGGAKNYDVNLFVDVLLYGKILYIRVTLLSRLLRPEKFFC